MTSFRRRLVLPIVFWVLSLCGMAAGQSASQHTAVITGRVIYEDGTPAAGISVLAEMQNTAEAGFMISVSSKMPFVNAKGKKVFAYAYEGPPPTQGFDHLGNVTKADGTYRIEGLATAPYNIVIARSEFGWIKTQWRRST